MGRHIWSVEMHPQEIRKQMLRGGAWAISGALVLSILGLGINALLARLVSTSQLGAYFLIVSLTLLFATLAQGGVLQVLLRRVALSPTINGKRAAAKILWSVSLYIVFGVVMVGALILVSFGHWSEQFASNLPELESLVFLFVAWVVVLAYQGVVTESFRGLHDIRYAVIFGGVLTSTVFISVLAVWYISGYRPMLNDVITLIVVISILAIILGALLLSRRLIAVEEVENFIRISSLYKESAPLLLAGLLAIVLAQGDLWIVGFYLGSEDAALYGAAVKIAVFVGVPLNLLNAVLPPFIAKLHAAGRLDELETILRGSAGVAAVPAAILTLIVVFAGEDLLGMVYGEHFRQAAPVLSLLCIGHFMHVVFGSGGLVLILTGHGKVLLTISLFSGVLLVIGGVVAARYGVSEIALAAACALALQKIIMWFWIKSKMGINTNARMSKNMFDIFRVSGGKGSHGN